MKKAPLPVIVISALIMLTGAFGLYGGWLNFTAHTASQKEALLVTGVNLLGILAGVFMLRGRNWARWLAVAWMAFHVVISFGHPLQQLIVHSILLVLFAYGLFRADARPFFQPKSPAA
jgi:uncharacterized membrane protein